MSAALRVDGAPVPLSPQAHAAALRQALQQLGNRLVRVEAERDAAVARAGILQAALDQAFRENAHLRRERAAALYCDSAHCPPAAG